MALSLWHLASGSDHVQIGRSLGVLSCLGIASRGAPAVIPASPLDVTNVELDSAGIALRGGLSVVQDALLKLCLHAQCSDVQNFFSYIVNALHSMGGWSLLHDGGLILQRFCDQTHEGQRLLGILTLHVLFDIPRDANRVISLECETPSVAAAAKRGLGDVTAARDIVDGLLSPLLQSGLLERHGAPSLGLSSWCMPNPSVVKDAPPVVVLRLGGSSGILCVSHALARALRDAAVLVLGCGFGRSLARDLSQAVLGLGRVASFPVPPAQVRGRERSDRVYDDAPSPTLASRNVCPTAAPTSDVPLPECACMAPDLRGPLLGAGHSARGPPCAQRQSGTWGPQGGARTCRAAAGTGHSRPTVAASTCPEGRSVGPHTHWVHLEGPAASAGSHSVSTR